MRLVKKFIYLPAFLILFSVSVFAQENIVDYYGIVTKELDANMAKMTSDLYFTQLTELDNFSVYDKRSTPSKTSIPEFSSSSENLIFYAEIIKNDSLDSWTVIFTVIDRETKEKYSISKYYDSIYKILMETKTTLQSTLKELMEKNPQLLTKETLISQNVPKEEQISNLTIKSIEILIGTWSGESSIDKIVILRGGRGFVVFKNGASMNVTISLEDTNKGQKILITQKNNSSPDFFPELPKNLAKNAALSAAPITWTMTLLNNMVMTGTKKTLIQDNESYKEGEISVIWEKIN